MSETFKRFLMDEGRPARYVALAAFGKHPGWDDHVEDLGLETDSLNQARLVLYVQGVGGQIDAGAWEKLKDEQRLAEFNHTFVWQRGDQFLIGRMWSSSDGKGRTRYPMILCAHCIGLPLGWALENVLPRLAEAEAACKATKSAEDVRSILGRTRASLRTRAASIPAGASPGPDAAALRQFVTAPAFGPSNEGWFRILYWLQSQAAMFGAGKFSAKSDASGLRAQQIRVPAGISQPDQALQAWVGFFGSRIDPQVPALFVWPLGADWVDATFGEPASQEFFCLRASRAAIPLATEIPYDMSQEFRAQAVGRLADFQAGRPPGSGPPPVGGQGTGNGGTSFTRKWLKGLGGKLWIVGFLILGIAALAAVYWKNQAARSGKTAGVQPAVRESPAVSQPPAAASGTQAASSARPQTADVSNAGVHAPSPETPAIQQANKPQVATAAPESASAPVEPRPNPPAPAAAPEISAPAAAPARVIAYSAPNPPTPSAPAAASSDAPSISTNVAPMPAGSIAKAITNGIGMALVWIAGLPGSGAGGWVGQCEVTEAEYQKLTGSNPSKSVEPDQPVENVTWVEAGDFCRKLTAAEHASGRLPREFAYSLPTQQQWDFFLDDAGYDSAVTSRDLPSPRSAPSRVGSLPPNRFGLCDVLGNVWEWCADSESADLKVLKGGAYDNGRIFQFKPLDRTTPRRLPAGARAADAGFRCVVVEQPGAGTAGPR